ncbi:MAG: lactate racemase domain-containing protein [Saccharofermentanales bacterium]
MRTFKIPYGNENVSFNVPDNTEVIPVSMPEVSVPLDPDIEINHALDNPIGTKKIEQLVKPSNKVCIICDDVTRPTPVKQILENLLKRLLSAGVSKKNIYIVFALGSHRYMTETEMIKRVGKEIFADYRVLNSEFKDPEKLIDMGYSKTGAKIFVSRVVMNSDIRIGIGNIVPHPAMGWSGGSKILYPGVTDEVTVTQFHIQQDWLKKTSLVWMNVIYASK